MKKTELKGKMNYVSASYETIDFSDIENIDVSDILNHHKYFEEKTRYCINVWIH